MLGILRAMEIQIDVGNQSYHTRLLGPPDLGRVQELFEASSEYFRAFTGQPPARDEARRAFVAGPPSKSVNDKSVLGVFSSAEVLLAVADVIRDWPAEATWSVGMLLVHPDHRRQGLGSSFARELERWAVAHGARKIRTAVPSGNEEAVAFLRGLHYRAGETMPSYRAGDREVAITFYERDAGTEHPRP